MVAGGHNGVVHFDSVEILDTEDGSVTLGSPMNSRRAIHGTMRTLLKVSGKNLKKFKHA